MLKSELVYMEYVPYLTPRCSARIALHTCCSLLEGLEYYKVGCKCVSIVIIKFIIHNMRLLLPPCWRFFGAVVCDLNQVLLPDLDLCADHDINRLPKQQSMLYLSLVGL